MLRRRLIRSRFPLVYAGFYLVVAAVVVRVANALTFGDAVVILTGIAVFTILAIMRDLELPPFRDHSAIYLGVQASIVAALLGIEPDRDFIAMLYVGLSVQSVLLLPERQGYLGLLAFSVVTAVLFFTFDSPPDAAAFTLTYCAAYAFFGLFGKAVVESEKARETSEGLLAELREKEASLRELAVSEERNRLAREIHDTLAQGFTGIILQLEAAEQSTDGVTAEAATRLQRAKSLARESLQEARRSMWNLLPHALEERSVEEALRDELRRFAAEGQAHTSFDVRGDPVPLGSEVQKTLLRVCQESLTNVLKHAAATDVSVTLSYDADRVRLQVLDNGIGIDLSAKSANGSGRGIAGMEERARLIQGRFLAEKAGSTGTRVSIEIPLTGEPR